MSGTIRIDTENMETIEAMYLEAAAIIDGIAGNLADAGEILGLHHEGAATEIYAACFERYAAHMDFLRSCCAAAAEHVRFARGDIVRADRVRELRRLMFLRGPGWPGNELGAYI